MVLALLSVTAISHALSTTETSPHAFDKKSINSCEFASHKGVSPYFQRAPLYTYGA